MAKTIILRNKVTNKEYPVSEADWQRLKETNRAGNYIVVSNGAASAAPKELAKSDYQQLKEQADAAEAGGNVTLAVDLLEQAHAIKPGKALQTKINDLKESLK